MSLLPGQHLWSVTGRKCGDSSNISEESNRNEDNMIWTDAYDRQHIVG